MRIGLGLAPASVANRKAPVIPFDPAVLAVADFENGVYTVGESTVGLADILTQNSDYSAQYDPADVVADVGLKGPGQSGFGAQPVLASTLYSALGSGFTIVADCVLADGGTIHFDWLDLPGWNNERKIELLDNNSFMRVGDYSDSTTTAIAFGAHKVAMTFSGSILAASLNGNAAISIVPTAASPTHLGLYLDDAGDIITKMTFYEEVGADNLPTLSAAA